MKKRKGISKKFREKFRTHTIQAITAAFGFLIALSWRTPIQNSVDMLIDNFNLQGSQLYVEIITALLITIIAVLALIIFSKWESKNE
ncbi:MAG: DUF5654 family protein [Candidatus Nanoarchaeia archaeon]